jgi:hypothetical protein
VITQYLLKGFNQKLKIIADYPISFYIVKTEYQLLIIFSYYNTPLLQYSVIITLCYYNTQLLAHSVFNKKRSSVMHTT